MCWDTEFTFLSMKMNGSSAKQGCLVSSNVLPHRDNPKMLIKARIPGPEVSEKKTPFFFFLPQIEKGHLSDDLIFASLTVISQSWFDVRKILFEAVAKSQLRELFMSLRKKNTHTPEVHPRETSGNFQPSSKGTTLEHSKALKTAWRAEPQRQRCLGSSLCLWRIREAPGGMLLEMWSQRAARLCICHTHSQAEDPTLHPHAHWKVNTFPDCLTTKSFSRSTFLASLVSPVCM